MRSVGCCLCLVLSLPITIRMLSRCVVAALLCRSKSELSEGPGVLCICGSLSAILKLICGLDPRYPPPRYQRVDHVLNDEQLPRKG